ncbi:MAG: aspartate carbamoyltransferase [Candidatus Aenigmarchaeota archaeon]|nr:aspartate carbamoyltransferase [Candidatus Aenigmarchaeota archaeon]
MVRHIVDTRQLKDRRFLEGLFARADEMKHAVENKQVIRKHEGKIVASLFYQPSTRTKMTFDTAAKRLGAEVIGTENAREFSSAFKGETLEHSLLAVQECFDIVVMRHDKDGAAKRAATILNIPFINAGDGKNQHPTQALLDLYTIRQVFGRIGSLKIAFVGDIAQGRTIKSLAYLLAHLQNNELFFVSPPQLKLPEDMRAYLIEKGAKFLETDDLDAVISLVDVLYVTRLQWEYVQDESQKNLLQESYRKYQITHERANNMKDGSIIMHPLPINTSKSEGFPEIASEVDNHPRALYFRQSNNGLYVRMALLDVLLTGPSDPLYNLILDVP